MMKSQDKSLMFALEVKSKNQIQFGGKVRIPGRKYDLSGLLSKSVTGLVTTLFFRELNFMGSFVQ